MKEPKPNLVKDEFASSMYINIDEYLELTNKLKKAKHNLGTIQDRLSYVSKSKAQNEVGKLLADGFIHGMERGLINE